MPKITRLLAVASLLLLATPALVAGCAGDDGNNTAPLVAPTDFTATYDAGSGAVQMTWSGSGGEDMFMVMRVEQNTDKTTSMWKVPSTQTTYDDTTAVSGTTYVYMVHAMQGEAISDPSDKITVTIP